MKDTDLKIEIRMIRPNDERRLRCFYEGLSNETFRSFYRDTASKEFFIQKAVITMECNTNPEKYLYMVAVCDDEIIGLGTLSHESRTGEGDEISHLISDEHQSRGVGSLLMEEMLAYAKTHWKGSTIVAHTALFNFRAKGLLKKFGFVLKTADNDEMIWAYKV